MSISSFVNTTVVSLDSELFQKLRDVLLDDYLQVSFIQQEDITVPVFSEKLCDFFEKTELRTGKSFERLVDKYVQDLDTVVGAKIKRTPKPKKDKPTPTVPRARKYYEKCGYLKKVNKESKRGLLDYTRIMLCLYAAIINNGFKEIEDFNLSMNCLNLPVIVEALRKETVLIGKKSKYDIEDPYSSYRSTFVILVIMFYYMKSKEIMGEY